LVLFTIVLLGWIPATAQEASNIQRSPQAIALIQRVLGASGGEASIGAVHDLLAAGTVSNPATGQSTAESAVTISLRGLDHLRTDFTLPSGTRSAFYNRGRLSSKETDGAVVPLGSEDSVVSTSHFFPLGNLGAALQDSSYSLTTPDSVTDEESGHALYHFRLQHVGHKAVGAERGTISSPALDYYIDATTDCILKVQNLHQDRGHMPIDTGKGPYEIYRFSDYRLDNGILLPHQLSVSLGRQLISTVNIVGYKLNTGLAESNFVPAPKQ
jgi:hypothetical protein